MLDLLRRVGKTGIRAAIKSLAKGEGPKNDSRFRRARQWVVLDEEGREIAHRPLIALACDLCDEQEMDPNKFGLVNDGVCRDWLESEGFKTGPVGSGSTRC